MRYFSWEVHYFSCPVSLDGLFWKEMKVWPKSNCRQKRFGKQSCDCIVLLLGVPSLAPGPSNHVGAYRVTIPSYSPSLGLCSVTGSAAVLPRVRGGFASWHGACASTTVPLPNTYECPFCLRDSVSGPNLTVLPEV